MDALKGDFFRIPIANLASIPEKINFTVYLRLQDANFVPVFSPHSGLDKLRLHKYSLYVKEVYVHINEKNVFENYTNQILSERVNREDKFEKPDPIKMPHAEKRQQTIKALSEATEKHLSEILMPSGVSDKEITDTKRLVKEYIHVITNDPYLLMKIMAKMNDSNYLYYHSLSTAMLGMYICRLMNQFSARLLEIIGVGGLLHDIGKIKIFEELGYIEFSQEENQKLKEHPQIGIDMLKDCKAVPEEVKQVIFQHHERPDGKGYPRQITGPIIYFPASVICVASTFSDYLGKAPFGLGMQPREAMKKILEDKGAFDKQILKHLTTLYRV